MLSRMIPDLFLRIFDYVLKAGQPELEEYQIEDRLIDNLLDKELEFTVEGHGQATIKFHSLGAGKKRPSTVVTTHIEGVEFDRDSQGLTLDFRYIFYKAFGHDFMFGHPVKFLISPPTVRKLGPDSILVECVIYGDTIHQVNRCLEIFAEVVRRHQHELHQTAIEKYKEIGRWTDSTEFSLNESITIPPSTADSIDVIHAVTRDESYIEEYIKYMSNYGEVRRTIDNRNTFAISEMD